MRITQKLVFWDKLLFYIGKDYYEFKGGERFSSYKYYLMFNRINNTLENTL